MNFALRAPKILRSKLNLALGLCQDFVGRTFMFYASQSWLTGFVSGYKDEQDAFTRQRLCRKVWAQKWICCLPSFDCSNRWRLIILCVCAVCLFNFNFPRSSSLVFNYSSKFSQASFRCLGRSYARKEKGTARIFFKNAKWDVACVYAFIRQIYFGRILWISKVACMWCKYIWLM